MVVMARDSDSRRAQRVNTLLAADALVGDTRWPVKIRNMSPLGAMVETSVKVDLNASIVLKRGILHAAGDVRWRRDGLFGVRFFEPAALKEWLGVPTREAIALLHDGSAEDDQLSECVSDLVLIGRVAEEIGYVERLISAVAAFLSEDAILRLRYCARIQELSMAADMLKQLSAVVLSDDKISTIETDVTGPMRQRMLR